MTADTKPPNHQAGRLYFAYGSNLSLAQMRVRCPEAIPVAAQDLPGYRLAFVGERTARWGRGGVATVVPQAGVSVHGALYRLSREDELALDGFEGVATGRYRKDILRIAGHSEPTLVYLANASLDAENMPNAKYLAVIRQGFADWGLPPEVLSGLSGYPAEEKT